MNRRNIDKWVEHTVIENQVGPMSSCIIPIPSINVSQPIYYSSPLSSPGFGTGGQFCSYPCTVSIVSTSPQPNIGFPSLPIPIDSPTPHYRTVSDCVCGDDSPEHVCPIFFEGIPYYPVDSLSNGVLIPAVTNTFGNFGYSPPPYQFEWQPMMGPMSSPPPEFSMDATQRLLCDPVIEEVLPDALDQEIEVRELEENEEGAALTAATAVVERRKRPKKLLPFCGFCYRNKEISAYYRSHDTKNEQGITTCPVLRNYICPTCKATGDNAHTRRYCTEIVANERPRKQTLRICRNARGVVSRRYFW